MAGISAREEEDRLLIARIVRRNTTALEILYHRYLPRLRRFLLGLGCAEADLDDACNDAFYVIWQKADSYDGSCRVSTWLFSIARYKAIDLLRKERRRAERHTETEIDELPEIQLNDAARLELQQWLEVALAKLPEEQRVVVELAFLDGMSYQEIATLMNCPENTVKTRMFHARRKLKHGFPEFVNRRQRRRSP